jgi:hypothetical protein
MSQIEELERAISSLPEDDYGRLREWFLNRDWEFWDRQIEDDSKAGRLDFLVREAAEAKQANRLRDL